MYNFFIMLMFFYSLSLVAMLLHIHHSIDIVAAVGVLPANTSDTVSRSQKKRPIHTVSRSQKKRPIHRAQPDSQDRFVTTMSELMEEQEKYMPTWTQESDLVVSATKNVGHDVAQATEHTYNVDEATANIQSVKDITKGKAKYTVLEAINMGMLQSSELQSAYNQAMAVLREASSARSKVYMPGIEGRFIAEVQVPPTKEHNLRNLLLCLQVIYRGAFDPLAISELNTISITNMQCDVARLNAIIAFTKTREELIKKIWSECIEAKYSLMIAGAIESTFNFLKKYVKIMVIKYRKKSISLAHLLEAISLFEKVKAMYSEAIGNFQAALAKLHHFTNTKESFYIDLESQTMPEMSIKELAANSDEDFDGKNVLIQGPIGEYIAEYSKKTNEFLQQNGAKVEAKMTLSPMGSNTPSANEMPKCTASIDVAVPLNVASRWHDQEGLRRSDKANQLKCYNELRAVNSNRKLAIAQYVMLCASLRNLLVNLHALKLLRHERQLQVTTGNISNWATEIANECHHQVRTVHETLHVVKEKEKSGIAVKYANGELGQAAGLSSEFDDETLQAWLQSWQVYKNLAYQRLQLKKTMA